MGAGIYVHLPFCPYICPYCDFAKWPYARSRAATYLAALEREIESAPNVAGKTLFLGGGTPNTFEPSAVAVLVERLRRRFALPYDAEISVEVNPDAALCADFSAYRRSGVSRLSFGVQSFAEAELAVLGRRHSASDVEHAVARARSDGFANLSLDLMFGVPGQTIQSWRSSLEAALALAPQHISTYGLTIEAGTPFAAWSEREPNVFAGDDLEAELYEIAIDVLESAGYEQYEISNFALPGFRCSHNEIYWANGEYVGLGVGAASFLGGVRSTHTRDLAQYVAAVSRGEPIPGESERLEGSARLGEATMLALRTRQGVDVAAFEERYGVDVLSYYERVLSEMKAAGMLEIAPTRVRLTRRGRFLANDVCAAFVNFE